MDWLQTGYIVNGHFMGYGKKIELVCRLKKDLDQVLISIQEFPPKSWKLKIWIPLIRLGNLSTVFWFSDNPLFLDILAGLHQWEFACWFCGQNFSASNWLFCILYTPLYWLNFFIKFPGYKLKITLTLR